MDMSEAQVLAKLVEALEKLQKPEIPLAVDLWDMEMLAQYFKRHAQSVRQNIACLPSFPKAIRLPTKARSHPLYNAKEVIEWANRHRDKN
jgi:hypothetical protein